MRILAVLLAGAAIAFGAGSVSQSSQALGTSGLYAVTFYWTGDASTGSVPATLANAAQLAQGYQIVSVETAPGTVAPTNGYQLTLKDGAGVDLLGGVAASVSSSAAQVWLPQNFGPPLYGSFSLGITGQSVAGAKGVVTVYLAPRNTIQSTPGLFVNMPFLPIVSAPASSSSACTTGQVASDTSYAYFCTATNTWRRVSTSNF